MNNVISQFWEWMENTIGKLPQEYAEKGMNQNLGEFEDEFPFFEECITYAKEIVDCHTLDKSKIDDLITVMAFDNESENVLEYIEENSSKKQIQMIIEQGVVHLQSQARLQVAELIYRTKFQNATELLNKLKNDSNEYVSRRANNCLILLEIETSKERTEDT